jgi:hypothetical protein
MKIEMPVGLMARRLNFLLFLSQLNVLLPKITQLNPYACLT